MGSVGALFTPFNEDEMRAYKLDSDGMMTGACISYSADQTNLLIPVAIAVQKYQGGKYIFIGNAGTGSNSTF